MNKNRLAIASCTLFLISGCASSPAASEAVGPGASSSPTSPASAAFASYIQGDWTCDKDSPDHFDASLELPVFGVDGLNESEISIGDGTWTASWGKDPEDKAEGTWKIDGREISIISPLGTQIVGNLPESPAQALEPMKLKIADTNNKATIQVKGERVITIKTSGGYVSDCTKF